MAYSQSIHGVFICIGYVSVMCRLCIGYVSVMYRVCVETSEGRKRHQDCAMARETTIQLQGYCKDNLDNFGDNEDNDSQQ